MNARRIASALTTGVVVAASFLLTPLSPAQAAAWCSGTTFQDFDEDDHADIVAARTLPGSQAGVVDIVMSGGTTQTISATSLGHVSAANDQFGASVHTVTLDATDNCPDLVIGAPGTVGGGAVYIVRGNGSGVADSATRISAPVGGARFGTAVGALDLSLTRARVLVGAPDLDVGSATDAGGVYVWQLGDTAEPTGTPALLTYADFGAAPAAGDHLGAVMDTYSWSVTLGVPYRNVGSANNAGEVITFSFVDEYGAIEVDDWARANQDSPGAPGVAETGDHFGASVDADNWVLAGVPGEDIGDLKNVGSVVRFAKLSGHTVGSWASWTQATPGIPGINEAGDRFGAAVNIAWVELTEDGDPYPAFVYVVGAPGEDVGKIKDAGAITVIPPVEEAYGLNQDSGLPGKAEQGDRVGAALGDFQGEYRGPYYGGEGIIVGAPGEDIGTVADAGMVMSTRGLLPEGRYAWTSTTSAGGAVAGGEYGWTLPSAS